MLYSLSRWRHERPSPPYRLGGRLLRVDGEVYLTDVVSQVRLEGDCTAGTDDLVIVHVSRCSDDEEDTLGISGCEVVHRCGGPRRLFSAPHHDRFTLFLQRVREFFIQRSLREVLTPSLVSCPGLEPSLEPFQTEVVYGQRREPAYLPTSPEISLKKALAHLGCDLFEVKRCFRNGERSNHHLPEFHMLEWYRAFADLDLIVSDLKELISALSREGWCAPVSLRVTDFSELFRTHLKLELTPQTGLSDLREFFQREKLHYRDDDTFDDLFHRLVIDRLEPVLKTLGPVIVRRFPPSQAALAKLDGEGWADRLELYWNGLEIANGFFEVTDAEEQRRRWQSEARERTRLGTTPLIGDEELLQDLETTGMPPSAGIALGVERLYMACTGLSEISELSYYHRRD